LRKRQSDETTKHQLLASLKLFVKRGVHYGRKTNVKCNDHSIDKVPINYKNGNWKGRQADRRTEGKMGCIIEHMDRQSDNLMEKWTDRQMNRWTDEQM